MLVFAGGSECGIIRYVLGEVAEWFKAHAWKACGEQSLAGSNPVFSASIYPFHAA